MNRAETTEKHITVSLMCFSVVSEIPAHMKM